jgi:hypothetical protein
MLSRLLTVLVSLIQFGRALLHQQESCDVHKPPPIIDLEALKSTSPSLYCDEYSVEYNAANELYQMEYSWKLIEGNIHPLAHLNNAASRRLLHTGTSNHRASVHNNDKSATTARKLINTGAAKHTYLIDGPITSPNNSNPCFSFVIQETGENENEENSKMLNFAPGGASFMITMKGDTSRVCSVINLFDGKYTVYCPRPKRGTCAKLQVILEW